MRRREGSEQPDLSALRMGAGVLVERAAPGDLADLPAPFGMALAAAAMQTLPLRRRRERVARAGHAIPGASICLLAGLGAAALLASSAILGVGCGFFAWSCSCSRRSGVIPLAAEAFHPYRSIHAQRARQFARRFWPEFVRRCRAGLPAVGPRMGEWDSTNLNVAVYLCNQMIYSPQRRERREFGWRPVSANCPLRCVLPLSDPARAPGRRLAGRHEGMLPFDRMP